MRAAAMGAAATEAAAAEVAPLPSTPPTSSLLTPRLRMTAASRPSTPPKPWWWGTTVTTATARHRAILAKLASSGDIPLLAAPVPLVPMRVTPRKSDATRCCAVVCHLVGVVSPVECSFMSACSTMVVRGLGRAFFCLCLTITGQNDRSPITRRREGC